MKLVFLERDSFGKDISIEPFSAFGEVISYPVLERELIGERVKDADILLINKAPVNGETMKDAKHLKLVCEMATGYDNVDVDWCRENGIAVVNAPDYSTNAVAQHTFALALGLLNKLVYYDDTVASGRYSSQELFTIFDERILELNGKTWGIAGMGNIGRKVAEIAKAFGCHVITYSTSGKPKADSPYESVSFEDFLQRSDLISLHCPLTEKTHHLFDEYAFSHMKESAVLINVARGPVVDQKALARALKDGQIAGAGLDVMEKEPISYDDELMAVKDSRRLLLTPHMAWASVESRQRDVDITLENIARYIKGERHHRVD